MCNGKLIESKNPYYDDNLLLSLSIQYKYNTIFKMRSPQGVKGLFYISLSKHNINTYKK